MGQIKRDTTYVPVECPEFRLRGVHPDWEMHPAWIGGIEALDAYNHWVSEVVLPIAFQWIEEHKSEVYAAVPDHLKDDVGVVTAAAFELIKELPNYKKGLEKSAAYEAALEDGTWDPATTNPVWTEIAEEVRTATDGIFAKRAPHLKSTIR